MEKVFLSVIVPCYNCAETISDTIDSIIRQSVPVDMEILCIDDCSSDGTSEILESFQWEMDFLKVYTTKWRSGRASVPRNIGIDKSKGEVVMFMDADDLLPRKYLENCLGFVSRREFVGALKYAFNSSAPSLAFYNNKKCKSMVIPRVVLYSKNMFSMSGLLIKKAALRSVEFENTYLEDWRMLVKLNKEGMRGRLLLCPRIFYRSHENSITPKKKSIQVKRTFYAMREMHGPLLPILLFPSYFFFGLIKILVEMAPGKSMSFKGGDAD